MPRIRQALKCSAHRKDGQPCGNFAIVGGSVCRIHVGAAKQVRRKAQERLLNARAAAALGRIARSPMEREHQEIREQAFPRAMAARLERSSGARP